jgi:hypothetical protein
LEYFKINEKIKAIKENFYSLIFYHYADIFNKKAHSPKKELGG